MVMRELTDAEVQTCRAKALQKFDNQVKKIEQDIDHYVSLHPEETAEQIERKRYAAKRNAFDNALICVRRNGNIFCPTIAEKEDDEGKIETFEIRQSANPSIDYKGNLLGALQAYELMKLWRDEMKKTPLAFVNGTSVEFNQRSAQLHEEDRWLKLGIQIFKTGKTPDFCPARVEETRLPDLSCRIAQFVSGILFLTESIGAV